MSWMMLLLVLAALLALARVVMIVRRARSAPRDDWDARMVKDLRASGANAFTPYEIDFFFTLPDEQACGSLRQRLESEGFATDARGMNEHAEGISLHASKRLRVSVSEMQDCTRRFQELAAQFGGHYDGWTTDKTRT
ncbi:MAG TPA: ribonuclease E inhibitor RraB [Steroidobacteraceae bacterium]|nr:ribonuclease E inhibitor RraB [Steroidobacteraceae bacterium]